MPLYVITLAQTKRGKSDNINQMNTISGDFYLLIFYKWDRCLKINVTTLSEWMLTLNGFHSNFKRRDSQPVELESSCR